MDVDNHRCYAYYRRDFDVGDGYHSNVESFVPEICRKRRETEKMEFGNRESEIVIKAASLEWDIVVEPWFDA